MVIIEDVTDNEQYNHTNYTHNIPNAPRNININFNFNSLCVTTYLVLVFFSLLLIVISLLREKPRRKTFFLFTLKLPVLYTLVHFISVKMATEKTDIRVLLYLALSSLLLFEYFGYICVAIYAKTWKIVFLVFVILMIGLLYLAMFKMLVSFVWYIGICFFKTFFYYIYLKETRKRFK